MQNKLNINLIYRFFQVGLALIPSLIGVLALLNDAFPFQQSVKNIAEPLITMHGNTEYMWRALPAALAPYLYTVMFMSEFMVGVLGIISIIFMVKNIFQSAEKFEASKNLAYIACLWGILVWGIDFFVLAGDWFLAWMSNNGAISGIQQGSLNYIIVLFVVFVSLHLLKENK